MKIVYLALGLWLLPGMLWAQSAEKENEFTMSMQIRPRAEYRNGAQFPRFEGDKAAAFTTTVHAFPWSTNART